MLSTHYNWQIPRECLGFANTRRAFQGECLGFANPRRAFQGECLGFANPRRTFQGNAWDLAIPGELFRGNAWDLAIPDELFRGMPGIWQSQASFLASIFKYKRKFKLRRKLYGSF